MHRLGCAALLVLLAAAPLRAQAPTLRRTLEGHLGRIVSHLAFSPDGKLLAAPCGEGTVKVWDATTGRARFTLKGHTDWAFATAFAPDGNALATVSIDGTARFWDLTSGREKLTLRVNNVQLYTVAFAQHGRTVAAGGQDNIVRLWDVASGREVMILNGHTSFVHGIAFAPGSRTLLSVGGDGQMIVWDLVKGASAPRTSAARAPCGAWRCRRTARQQRWPATPIWSNSGTWKRARSASP